MRRRSPPSISAPHQTSCDDRRKEAGSANRRTGVNHLKERSPIPNIHGKLNSRGDRRDIHRDETWRGYEITDAITFAVRLQISLPRTAMQPAGIEGASIQEHTSAREWPLSSSL
jgi:hypothetical protein